MTVRRVTRGLTILAAFVSTLAVTLPASADNAVTLKGTIVAVSAGSVTFQDAKGVSTTCLLGARSPSLDGYATGDTVRAACVHARAKLLLAAIQHAPTGGGSGDTRPVTFGGVVTALSDTSISLHDGNHDLTCAIGASSPSTAGVKVGGRVKVACANGVLVALMLPPAADGKPAPPPPPPPNIVTVGGVLSALSATSLTVHNAEHGDVSCSLGPSSPRLGDFHLGDHVGMACADGVLVKIARLP